MGNYILAGIALFLIALTVYGYSKGLVRMIFSVVSVFIILILVTIFSPIAKEIVTDSPVEKWIYEKTDKYVDDSLNKVLEDSPVSGLGKKEQAKVINKLSLPENIRSEMIKLNTEKGYKNFDVDNFSDYVTAFVTDKIIDALVFVVLLIVVSILVYLAIFLLDVLAKLPIIKFFNKGGGAVLGFVEGVLIVWVACIFITMFSTTDWGQAVFKEIDKNPVLEMIYNNNYLQMLVDKIV